jgi:hypothetical protein
MLILNKMPDIFAVSYRKDKTKAQHTVYRTAINNMQQQQQQQQQQLWKLEPCNKYIILHTEFLLTQSTS